MFRSVLAAKVADRQTRRPIRLFPLPEQSDSDTRSVFRPVVVSLHPLIKPVFWVAAQLSTHTALTMSFPAIRSQSTAVLLAALLMGTSDWAGAAGQQSSAATAASTTGGSGAAVGIVVPPGYVIGANDMLSIVFWRDKDMSADVVVRPDGKVSLPLLNDVTAAGLTPEQLRAHLTQAAGKYVADPVASVVVKEIRSRNVFITGMVAKPGTYPLMDQMTVLQLIAVAGGIREYADSKNIMVMRKDNGRQQSFKFNYKDVVKQRNVGQNISLMPGDTVIVP